MTKDCIICFAIEHEVSQEILLAEFGAVALWQAQARHDSENHQEVTT
jgi:hypothetical protein